MICQEELETVGSMPGVEVIHTLTRSQPPGWTGHSGRIDRQLLSEVAWPPSDHPLCFVCGPTGLVEAATALTDLGHDPGRVRTERFGPSGGTP